MGLRIQKDELTEATTPTATFNIMSGRNRPPEKIYLVYKCNANIDSETLDIYGMPHGSSDYATAVLVSQITQAANADVIVDLSATLARACWKIKVVSGTLAATEQTDLLMLTWSDQYR